MSKNTNRNDDAKTIYDYRMDMGGDGHGSVIPRRVAVRVYNHISHELGKEKPIHISPLALPDVETHGRIR